MIKHDTILLISASADRRRQLRHVLEGSYNLLEASGSKAAKILLQQNIQFIAAVLLDISGDGKNSDLSPLQENAWIQDECPVIALTVDESSATINRAFRLGAADVIPFGYDPDAMAHRIENISSLHVHKKNLEDMVAEQTNILRRSNDTMVDTLSSMIEYRSVESGQHILRIRHFTRLLLERLAESCPEYELTDIQIGIISSAAALHDIGKIAIPDSILTKPGRLNAEEWEIMKTHTSTGCRILERLGGIGDKEYLRYAYNICRYHHERWDGGGYPEGLAGDDIPICAQVVGLADAYDALTTKRAYKEAYPYNTAVNMILKGECGQFSPKLIECFKHVTGRYEELAKAYADGLTPESENFDLELPAPKSPGGESMERIQAKYFAMVHHINAFLMEIDFDNSLFHIIYNPYPEFTAFHTVNSLSEIAAIALEKLVVTAEREGLRRFIHEDIKGFIEAELRHASWSFLLKGRANPEGEPYRISLLRINPTNSERHTLAVLCQKESLLISSNEESEAPGIYSYCCLYDKDFSLVSLGVSDSLAGYSRKEIDELFGGKLIHMIHPEDRQMVMDMAREQLRKGANVELRCRAQHKNGSIITVLNKSRRVHGKDNKEYIYGFATDVSSLIQPDEQLELSLQRYQTILAQTENVLFEWDAASDTILFSDTWEKIFGYAPVSESFADNIADSPNIHPDDLPALHDRIISISNGSDYEVVELRILTGWGRYIWCLIRATVLRNNVGVLKKIMGIIINIDAEKQTQQALKDRADRDSLTKLLNKQAGRRQAEEYLDKFSQGSSCAMILIDLDNFKQINDNHGHLFGDSVLLSAAREIKKRFRNQDIIARVGGDEFMVLMRGVSDKKLVEDRCVQLVSALREPLHGKNYGIIMGCSVGVALSPEHGSSFNELFQKADMALYQAKNKGKSAYVFYDGEDAELPAFKASRSAISESIDSDTNPLLTENEIVRHAFERLYSSRNTEEAINDILRLIGQQMNVSRVYIFENSPDNKLCSNTYEWCNKGIEPQIDKLQNIDYEQDVPGFLDIFDENGVFYCPDTAQLEGPVRDVLERQGIKSMLQCAIMDKGQFRGYIGFDECVTQRMWTKEQIRLLSFFSEMLSVFLVKEREREEAKKYADELSSVLDKQNAWIYIIDPESHELKFVNARAKALVPELRPGTLCYRALFGRNSVCANCPVAGIYEKKNSSTIMKDEKYGTKLLVDAAMLQWEGRELCMVTGRKLPEEY